MNRNNGSQALVLAEEARQIYGKLGARVSGIEHARAVSEIGNALHCLKRHREAAQALSEAIALQKDSNYPYLPDTLRIQGIWYSEAGNYEDSIRCFLESIRILEIDDNQEFLAIDLYNLGRSYIHLQKYEEAILVFLQALGIFRDRKDLSEVSSVYSSLAEAHISGGRPEAGLQYAEKCYAIAHLRKDNQFLCRGALSKAKAHQALGNLDLTSENLCEADYIASSSNDWELMLDIQNEYLMLYRNLNRFEEADRVECRIATIREILG